MKVVTLHVYKGKRISLNEDGSIQNINQTVKLTHGVKEWFNYLKNLHIHGYCKVDVDKIVEISTAKKGHEVSDEEIRDEVLNSFEGNKSTQLTPEQIKIAELEAKLDLLVDSNKSSKKGKADNTSDANKELEVARDEYLKLTGKKPHHLWRLEKINEKISELKN